MAALKHTASRASGSLLYEFTDANVRCRHLIWYSWPLQSWQSWEVYWKRLFQLQVDGICLLPCIHLGVTHPWRLLVSVCLPRYSLDLHCFRPIDCCDVSEWGETLTLTTWAPRISTWLHGFFRWFVLFYRLTNMRVLWFNRLERQTLV